MSNTKCRGHDVIVKVHRPPIRRGIDYLVYAHVIENHNCFTILAISVNFRWPNLAQSVKRHIYTPRPFIGAYNQVSTTLRSKILARSSFENQLFLGISPTSGGRIWPKVLKGTVIYTL